MKVKLLIAGLMLFSTFSVISCTSSKGGCKASQGYVGYGHR